MMAIAVCAFALQSCKSKPTDKDVQAVVTSFEKAVANENFDEAKKLSTESSNSMLDMQVGLSTGMPDSLIQIQKAAQEKARNATITFGKTTFNEDGTEATVIFTSSDDGMEDTHYLIKEGDKWLVDMEGGMPEGE